MLLTKRVTRKLSVMAWCRVCGEPCFTHCIYCGADCDLPDPAHGVDCPQSTGLWPAGDECCCDCGDPVGEFYVVEDGGDGWGRVLCVPCGVLLDEHPR